MLVSSRCPRPNPAILTAMRRFPAFAAIGTSGSSSDEHIVSQTGEHQMTESDRTPDGPPRGRGPGWKLIAGVAVLGLLAAVGGAALLANIMERKQEARNPFYRVVNLTDTTTDPAVWGKNF